MRELGIVPTIYDDPPHEFFWIFYLVADGDIFKMQKMWGLPLTCVYAVADKKIKEATNDRN